MSPGQLLLPGALLAIVIANSAADLRRCSRIPYSHRRSTSETLLLGTALGAVAPVGDGGVAYRRYGGHWGRASLFGRVRGQAIRVERLDGNAADSLAALFARSADSTVWIVPWDYGPDCRPTLWTARMPWSPVDSLGAYTVELRAPAHWHRGRPTFDAFAADLEPYPFGLFFEAGYRDTDVIAKGGGLTATQFFQFYLHVPVASSPGSGDVESPELLFQWEAANPDLAQRFPADRVIAAWRRTQ